MVEGQTERIDLSDSCRDSLVEVENTMVLIGGDLQGMRYDSDL